MTIEEDVKAIRDLLEKSETGEKRRRLIDALIAVFVAMLTYLQFAYVTDPVTKGILIAIFVVAVCVFISIMAGWFGGILAQRIINNRNHQKADKLKNRTPAPEKQDEKQPTIDPTKHQ
jgi:hypothetical protein